MARSLDFIRKFTRYSSLESNEHIENKFVDAVDATPEIVRLVYAPNPKTGLPSSDLAFMLDKNQSEDVKAFIRNNLMSPRSVSSGADADTAIEFTQPRGYQEYQEYKDKLTQFVDNLKAEASK